MKCPFVSAFDRPQHHAAGLASLRIQTESDFEVIVTNNGRGTDTIWNAETVKSFGDPRFSFFDTQEPDCYLSLNRGAAIAKGDYLCFPSDDGYYGPRFLAQMLIATPADLIYCDCIYDGHGCNYAPMETAPVCGQIDKRAFLIRRERFPGFGGPAGVPRAADGRLIEQLVSEGVKYAKVPRYMWVHN